MSGFRPFKWGAQSLAPEAVSDEPVPASPDQFIPTPRMIAASELRTHALGVQFARALQDEIDERRWTVSTLADIIRMRRTHVALICQGRHKPHLSTIERVCFKLGWSLTIHDRRGRLIVRYPPAEDASAESPATAPR